MRIKCICAMIDIRAHINTRTTICKICIWGIIYCICINKSSFRYLLHQLSKILCKRFAKIKVHTIVHRISTVGSSNFLVIDFIRFVRRINRNDRFFAGITLATVEFTFITKGKSATLTLFWTESRSRDLKLLTMKSRRYLRIKIPIWLKDRKWLSWYSAGLSFDNRVIRLLGDELIDRARGIVHDVINIEGKIALFSLPCIYYY